MGRPTIFYILENHQLDIWYVGRLTITVDVQGWSPYRSVTQDELCNKLIDKYDQFFSPYLTLTTLNKGWKACYGVERWLSKLDYKIKTEYENFKEVEKLLTSGWDGKGAALSTLSVLHVFNPDHPIDEIFKKLVKSREGLTKCLNNAKFQTYNDRKEDIEFIKKRARNKVLYDIKKKQKLPKQSTLDKYDIKDHEIKKLITSV